MQNSVSKETQLNIAGVSNCRNCSGNSYGKQFARYEHPAIRGHISYETPPGCNRESKEPALLPRRVLPRANLQLQSWARYDSKSELTDRRQV